MSRPQRLPSGKWRVRYIDAAGKRKSETYNTEAAARAGLRRRLVEVDDIRSGRVEPKIEAPMFRAFVTDRWLPTYPKAAGNRELTVREKQRHVDHHLMPELGDVRLDQVRGEVVDKLFAILHDRLAPKSVKNVRATLGTILRSAKKWGVLADVPELPKVKVPERAWDFYTREESDELFGAAVDPEERALLIFAVHTGARFGEQRVFPWEHVDWHRRQVSILQAMPHNTSEIAPTKSGRGRRIAMSDTLHDALKAVRGLRHLQGGLIFGRRRDGKALTLDAMSERLRRASRRAGLRPIRWHDLRHHAASGIMPTRWRFP